MELESVISALQGLAPQEPRAHDVVGCYPGIDPLFWLWSQTGSLLPNTGGMFLGRAGETGEPVSHVVQYSGGRFRKDKVHNRDPKTPLALLGFVSAGKNQRSQSTLDALESAVAKESPSVIVLDVFLTAGLKPEDVREKLVAACCQEGRQMVAWVPVSLRTMRVPAEGQRLIFGATSVSVPKSMDVQKYMHSLVHCVSQATGSVKLADYLLREGDDFLAFLDAIRHRKARGKSGVPVSVNENAEVEQSAEARAADEEATEPSRKKPRCTMDLPELLTDAVKGGWVPDTPATLSKLELVEQDYEKLPKKSAWMFVLAKILESKAKAAHADEVPSVGTLITDTKKAFNVSAGALPRLSSSSEFLVLISESQCRMSLRLLHPEEILAMYGYKLKSVSLQLVKTQVGRMIFETTPINLVIVMLALCNKICSEASGTSASH